MKNKFGIVLVETIIGALLFGAIMVITGGMSVSAQADVCSFQCCSNSNCGAGQTCFYAGTVNSYCQTNYNAGGSGTSNPGASTSANTGTVTPPSGCQISSTIGCCSNSDCGGGNQICLYGGTPNAYCQTNYSGVGGPTTPGNAGNTPVCLISFDTRSGKNVCTGGSGCALDPSGQSCSVQVTANQVAASPQAACNALAGTDLSSALRQNVTGGGPNGITTSYNTQDYATLSTASLLAQCLGGSVRLASNEAANSPFYIPEHYEIILPNGAHENAGSLATMLISRYSGNVSQWQQQWVTPLLRLSANGAPATSNGTGSGAPTTGGGSTGTTGFPGSTGFNNGTTNTPSNVIAAVINGIQQSISTFRTAESQAGNNGSNGAGVTNSNGNTANNTQTLLSALQGSLTNISTAIGTGAGGVTQGVSTAVNSLIDSIRAIILTIQTGVTSGVSGSGTSNATTTASANDPISFTANGQEDIYVNVGDSITYKWSTTAPEATSSYTMDYGMDTCYSPARIRQAYYPWNVTSTVGQMTEVVKSCQAGVTYTVNFMRVLNGQKTAKQVIVRVRPL